LRQERGKQHRIAIVISAGAVAIISETSSDPLRRRFYQSFFEDLRRLGDIEGQNLVIERYSGEGRPGGLPDPIDLAPSFARRRSTQAERLHWPLKQPNQLFNRAIALCRNAG
jgi:hypothetical protein